jgi:hypothetical protein
MRRSAVPAALGIVLSSFARDAAACPSCPTADAVRCIVFGEGFWTTLAIATLPFAIVGGISVFLHGAGATGGSGGSHG